MKTETFFRVLFRLTVIGTALSLLNLLPFGRISFLLELNNNLGSYYLVAHLGCLLLLPVFLIVGVLKPLIAVCYGFIALVMSYYYYLPVQPFVSSHKEVTDQATPSQRGEYHQLRVLFWNTEIGNPRATSAIHSMVEKHSPDLIALLEMTPAVRGDLRLDDTYPFSYVRLNGHFGYAIYSRLPLGSQPLVSLGDDVKPVYINTVTVGGRDIELMVLHPPPQVTDRGWLMNRLLARRVSTRLRHTTHPVLILGDLNATPHSKQYQRIKRAGRLSNAMYGRGWYRTWNAHHWLFRLPIDHIMYRSGKGDSAPTLQVKSATILDYAGSDHFPLVVEFRVGRLCVLCD